jgi:hypothetical protein
MARIFAERGVKAEGKVLPLDKFEHYIDLEEKSFTPEKGRYVIEEAEKYLEEDIPTLPLSLYREFTLNGNRTNYEGRCFKRRNAAMNLAIAELCENKGRFVDKLCDYLWAISEETSWIIPAHTIHSPSRPHTDVPEVYSSEFTHGIDLFSASCSASMAMICYFLKDKLDAVSPLIRERMEHEIYERSIKPYMTCVFSWTGERGNKVNNWNPWIVSNLLYVTAVTVKDTALREKIVSKAMSHLDNFTSFYADDGGCDEGPGYWFVAGAAYFHALEIIYDMTGGAINVYDHPLVAKIGEYCVNFAISKKYHLNFGDSHPGCGNGSYVLARMGKVCGSKSMLAYAGSRGIDAKCTVNGTAIPYSSVKALVMPDFTEYTPAEAPPCFWYDSLKVMIARETPDTEVGTYLAAKGAHNAQSHNHNDVGSFVVYKDGKPVIIDVGVGAYTKQTFSADRYKLWFMQSEYHNLPTIGGKGELPGPQYSSCEEVCDLENKTLTMELKNAYSPECGILSYKRSFRLTGGRVEVTENIALDEAKEIDLHYMTHVKPTLNPDGSISLAEGMTMRFGEALTPEIEEFYSEGLNAKSSWGTENLYRIHLRTTAASYVGTVVIE